MLSLHFRKPGLAGKSDEQTVSKLVCGQKRVRAEGRLCKMYSDNNTLLSRRNVVDCLIDASTIKYLGASSHNCIPQPLFLCRAK